MKKFGCDVCGEEANGLETFHFSIKIGGKSVFLSAKHFVYGESGRFASTAHFCKKHREEAFEVFNRMNK